MLNPCRNAGAAGTLLLSLLAVLVVPVETGWAQSTYEERHATLHDSLAGRRINLGQRDGPHRAGRTGFWTTQGRLQRGKEDPKVWSDLLATLSNTDGAEDAGGANGGFSAWPAMDTYLRWKHRMPPQVLAAYEQRFREIPTYGKGATPNQRMMWAAACRLACETWGAEAVTRLSDASYRTGDKTGRRFILDVCDRAVRRNFDERWSKHYLLHTLGPLRSIADLSTDRELAQRARMAWNWGWLDIATFSFHGRWAIPAGRGGITLEGNRSDIGEFGSWLLFGGTPRASLLDADQCVNLTQPAIGRPGVVHEPPILPEMLAAATRRNTPFTRRGLARGHETQFASSFLTRDWALYSQTEGDTALRPDGTLRVLDLDNAGVPSNDWSSERWGLLWDDSGPAGLTMKPPTGYKRAQGSGLGPHEDVVQHEGTLVGILNLPAEWPWQFTRDTIPTNTLAVINDAATTGRLYLHYSKVLVAITRSDIGAFGWPPAPQTPATKRGFAIECASVSEFSQTTATARLAAFKAQVERHPPDFSGVGAPTPRMTYTNRAGRVLEVTYGRGGRIDDDPIDYEGWPLQESPWSSQRQMGNLWVFGDDRTLLWNYLDWSESEDHRPSPTTTTPVPLPGTGALEIDLAARVRDAESSADKLLFEVSDAQGGTVRLLTDGHTARFEPSTSGSASFSFSVGGAFPDHRTILHYDYAGLAHETSTLRIHDRSTAARDGALSAPFVTGPALPPTLARFGERGSLRTGGATSQRVSRALSPATLDFANHDWVFSTWVIREREASAQVLLHLGARGGERLEVLVDAASSGIRLRHLQANGTADDVLSTANALPLAQWRHVALQYERRSHRTGVFRLLVDGVERAVSEPLAWSPDQSEPLWFGGAPDGDEPRRCLEGALADTLLLRGQLDHAELVRLATAPAAFLGGCRLTQRVTLLRAPETSAAALTTATNRRNP